MVIYAVFHKSQHRGGNTKSVVLLQKCAKAVYQGSSKFRFLGITQSRSQSLRRHAELRYVIAAEALGTRLRNGGKVYFQCHVYDLNTELDLKAKGCRLTFAVLVCEGNNANHATETGEGNAEVVLSRQISVTKNAEKVNDDI